MGYFGLLDNPSFGPQRNLSLRPCFSAIIWQQIISVPLLLTTFLPPIKTIVPIPVNTNLRIQAGEALKVP